MAETLTKIINKYPAGEADIIRRAFDVGQNNSDNTHSLEVAKILADMDLDYETVVAGLLHDVMEKTDLKQEYLEKELLVISMRKLNNLTISEYLDYNEAKDTVDKLLLDLRGT